MRRYGIEASTSSLDLFAGIIRLMWQEQFQFWEQHLAGINAREPSAGSVPPDKMQMYKTKIRFLATYKDKCLPGHQDQYFPDDVEQFLQTATGTQMKRYIFHYESAILTSVAAANKQNHRTIHTFPGYTRTRPNSLNQAPPSRNTPTPPSMVHPTAARGTQMNRKHTRWKLSIPSVPNIRQFFLPKPP